MNSVIEEVETLGRSDLVRQGFAAAEVQHQLEFDMRYGNQLVQLSVLSPVQRLRSIDDILGMIEEFNATYAKRYGKRAAAPEAGVKIASIRVLSWVPSAQVSLRPPDSSTDQATAVQPQAAGERQCYFTHDEEAQTTPIYKWADLVVGACINGPAIVEASHTTFVVEPGWEFQLDTGDLVRLTDRAPRERCAQT